MNPGSRLSDLLSAPVRPGRVTWIGLRPGRREALVPVTSVTAEPGTGLTGDRYTSRRDGPRQVTLVQAEHLAAIASYLGRDSVDPADLRRNIVTRGVNLLALRHKRFRLGTALLEYTGECHPCSRMEENFGPVATMRCAATAASRRGCLPRAKCASGTSSWCCPVMRRGRG